MHAYYGVNQLNSASPTLLETVHQLENSSVISPEGLYNNNGSMPSNEPASLTPYTVNGTIITSTLNGDAAALSSQHLETTLVPPTDMAGYSSSSYFTPISTTPSLLFRSPSMYIQGPCGMPGHPPLLPPTINSPMIQMAAPTTISSPSNSSWQHTVPRNMPWMSSPNTPTTIKFTASHGQPTVCEMERNLRGPKRRHSQDENSNTDEAGGKIHINEERMAARMQELTLDNNNLDWVPDLEESWYAERPNYGSDGQEIESMNISGANGCRRSPVGHNLPKLEVSDLLKMNFTTKEILPQVILDQLTKPCMELVLWKPPGTFVTDVVSNITGKKSVSSMTDSGSPRPSTSYSSEMWSVDQTLDQGNGIFEVDPSAVPLPDDDDMEL